MFDLHNLGWHSFQQLCLSVAREVLGQTVESFLDVNDGGRDGAFAGHWRPTNSVSLSGQFVIQCKFTNRRDYSLKPSDVEDEIDKVDRLVKGGLCDVYLLLTNAGISGRSAEAIRDRLLAAGTKEVVLLGSSWIEQQIRDNKRLRMLVPRVYGLGDLTQILDERSYSQARAILESMREDLAKVVVTDSYRRSAHALDEHGYVLLIGEPAAGKTTIASMLAMTAADQWRASVMKLDSPAAVVARWNPDEPSQFFWVDDAFGVTQYENGLVSGWNHVIPDVKTMLRRGAKIVMTSRDYIYNRARQDLKEGAFPLFNEAMVVIDVHGLTEDERRQILYNHLKLGTQSQDFRSSIKPYLEEVAAHERFIPEIARRLADPFFTKALRLNAIELEHFVEKREQFLVGVLRELDRHSRAALALIYMRNDRLASPISLAKSEEDALQRLNSDLGSCIEALQALKGSLVIQSRVDDEYEWKFKHPTIADAFALILRDSPELLEIYVRGSSVNKLLTQVTCGDVGIENAVVLPRSLFTLVVDRLDEYAKSSRYKTAWMASWDATRSIHHFLSRRCCKEMLQQYISKNPKILEQVSSPGLYLDSVSETSLAVRFHELGLLPDECRERFVEKVGKYAVEGEDVGALTNKRIQTIFTEAELQTLVDEVRRKLLPRLNEVRHFVEDDFRPGNESAEEHMSRYVELLDELESRYGDDPVVKEQVEAERTAAGSWISNNSDSDETREDRVLGQISDDSVVPAGRSIFDDVDQ
ncbi:hypothetical protein SAMN04487926_15310 [Paraburkholderia steynii]|uniref:Novel STAND NTPase 3 domain-containing protein n=1 Tax=Paraburkholderia steynii TaxID=1245441 RepID=A0A7Z7BKL1_9BURK|nr:hypothetical protein [Paraburkholderia steynii]SDJ46993.1 hypothetical protein SAMN04487926_15310 [Paraburkholderia steynii]